MIPIYLKNYLDVAIAAALALIVTLISPLAGFFAWHLAFFVFWHIRDTKKYTTKTDRTYLSPVDGRVTEIQKKTTCPYSDGDWTKVTITTNLYDSHVQYSPIDGTLVRHELTNVRDQVNLSDLISLWLSNLIKFDFTLPMEFIHKNILLTEIYNQKNGNRCMVETIADHWKLNLVSSIQLISHSGFVDQGSRIGTAHFGLHKFYTNLYLEDNSNVLLDVGHTVVAGETVVATKSGIVYRTFNPDEMSTIGS